METWVEGGREIRAEIWDELVLPNIVPNEQAKSFLVVALYDSAYTTPWLLATPLKLKAATVKAIYQ